MQIRESVDDYMRKLRAWLRDTENTPLEEMGAFFAARLSGYEEHMSQWREGYRRMAELVPPDAKELLDVGCGTGLELDELLRLRPDIRVTGVDLSKEMLGRLNEKHPDVTAVCADYLKYQPRAGSFDAAISFETLHHLTPGQKALVFSHILDALKPGGEYIQADYIACCAEEETLLRDTCARKRLRDGVPEGQYVHFDTPLTPEHELALMRGAGFSAVEPICVIEGACFMRARKSGGCLYEKRAWICPLRACLLHLQRKRYLPRLPRRRLQRQGMVRKPQMLLGEGD